MVTWSVCRISAVQHEAVRRTVVMVKITNYENKCYPVFLFHGQIVPSQIFHLRVGSFHNIARIFHKS